MAVAVDALNRIVRAVERLRFEDLRQRTSSPEWHGEADRFICSNTAVPTVTVTGMVEMSVAVWKTTWPRYVPASAPPPGRFAAVTEIVAMQGQFRSWSCSSQAPPSAVVVAGSSSMCRCPHLRFV